MARKKRPNQLIQYKEGIFSRIKVVVLKLFQKEKQEEENSSKIVHQRLHEVLAKDRIQNHDIRVAVNGTIPKIVEVAETMNLTKEEAIKPETLETKDNITTISKEIIKETEEVIKANTKEAKKKQAEIIEFSQVNEQSQADEKAKTKAKTKAASSYVGSKEINELINICKILESNNVKVKNIKASKKSNKHRIPTELKDIKQPNIEINRIIEDNKLDENYPIGKKIELIRRRIYNIDKYRRDITNEQIATLTEYGIISTK